MKAVSAGTNMMGKKEDSVYISWTKEQLIRRITELENANKQHRNELQHIDDNKKRKLPQEGIIKTKTKKTQKSLILPSIILGLLPYDLRT